MKNGSIILVVVLIIVIAIIGVGGYFAYQKFIIEKTKTSNNFDVNTYLPGKVILSTFTSGAWGKFNADHTITLNWTLDYAGQNDNRPSGGTGEWITDKNVLTITEPGGLAGKYDFSKMGKINVGDKIIYADQYGTLADGRYVGVFIGDDFNTLGQLTGVKITGRTVDWKTYINTQYGFEVKYPDSLSFLLEGSNNAQKDLDAGKTISGTVEPSYETISFRDASGIKKFEISIFHKTDKALTIENWKNYFYTSGLCDLRYLYSEPVVSTLTKNTVIINAKAVAENPSFSRSCYYFKNNNNNLMVISLLAPAGRSDYEMTDKIIQDILSTLKFIK